MWLAEVVLGIGSDKTTFRIYLGNQFYLDKRDLFAMERKRLVNLPFSQGLHVVHLVLTELVRHLLRGRACWQLAVRRPFLLAGFALTIKEEVLLVESLMSGKGKVTHPEELFSCRDTQLAENRTIVVCNLLPLREFVSRENSIPTHPF